MCCYCNSGRHRAVPVLADVPYLVGVKGYETSPEPAECRQKLCEGPVSPSSSWQTSPPHCTAHLQLLSKGRADLAASAITPVTLPLASAVTHPRTCCCCVHRDIKARRDISSMSGDNKRDRLGQVTAVGRVLHRWWPTQDHSPLFLKNNKSCKVERRLSLPAAPCCLG